LVIVVFRWSPAAEVVEFLFVAQRITADNTRRHVLASICEAAEEIICNSRESGSS
jgi:hypothetical protein